jgi:beta-phosphoglucomutase
MIQGVIFDLDGVLTDTAVYHYQSWKQIASSFNFELTEKHNEQLKGVSRSESLDHILSWAGITLDPEMKNRLLVEKNGLYLDLIQSLSSRDILPGVTDFLHHLIGQGVKTAVGSSSKNANFILSKIGLMPFFEVVVDGTMVKQTKPDPEVFLLAAASLGLNPESCLVVEDAEAGVEAAKSAGMKVLGISAHGNLIGADHEVQNLIGVDTKYLLSHLN